MLQGHINLICAPVHEAHREYYEIIKKYKLKEYQLGKEEATRLCNRAGVRYAFKETMTMPIQGFIKKDSDKLFGTLPKAEQDLLNRTFKSSEKTLSRVDDQLNKIITDGYRGGKGINDIANQVTRRFDQLSSWEAKRIARTEVNTSHNKATVDTYQDFGVEYTQWIAAADDRTRDSHVEVDGEIIPMGGKYSNGLGYPGDMSGPIEEWINCRCSNAPFVIPFGYMAPSFSPFRESDLIPIIENPVEPTQEQIDANLTDEQRALYNKYQQNISDAQKVVDGLFSTPNERLQAQHLIETETIKLNQLKMIAHGELGRGYATLVKRAVTINEKPAFDQEKFDQLKTHEEVAEFFGLEYIPKGIFYEQANMKTFEFYDPKTDTVLRFVREGEQKCRNIDFSNSGKCEYDLKEVVRIYEETHPNLKVGLNDIVFLKGDQYTPAGDAGGNMVRIYDEGLSHNFSTRGIAAEKEPFEHVLDHELGHIFDNTFVKLVEGEFERVTTVAPSIEKPFEDAGNLDIEYQKNNGLPVQKTSDYAETNLSENFAEVVAMVGGLNRGKNYKVYAERVERPAPEKPRGYIRDSPTLTEVKSRNPNQFKYVESLVEHPEQIMPNWKQINQQTVNERRERFKKLLEESQKILRI